MTRESTIPTPELPGHTILKHHRGFATRYDKLAVRFAATVHIAVIDHWLRRLT